MYAGSWCAWRNVDGLDEHFLKCSDVDLAVRVPVLGLEGIQDVRLEGRDHIHVERIRYRGRGDGRCADHRGDLVLAT